MQGNRNISSQNLKKRKSISTFLNDYLRTNSDLSELFSPSAEIKELIETVKLDKKVQNPKKVNFMLKKLLRSLEAQQLVLTSFWLFFISLYRIKSPHEQNLLQNFRQNYSKLFFSLNFQKKLSTKLKDRLLDLVCVLIGLALYEIALKVFPTASSELGPRGRLNSLHFVQ